ncbi:hypothetical protein SS50377_23515 [Spironucleus salmonicida]|uniref:RING-type domain-containing protein n=1 Tax=Spironucleus salmonicida TaxID=348837 RepID=V6LPT7_9EUKA|nr:hypothetical protein SS50377_23515 [Spironucleus salmonicida]|eukprot:EST46253.1 hypothetical protein SS50377_13849 [Spironucleus salmonicida]
MLHQDLGECPICCDPYTDISQAEFYFCPCKFQFCGMCKAQLLCCPNCRRIFDDYEEIIPNPFLRYSYKELNDLKVKNNRLVRLNHHLDGDLSAFGEIVQQICLGATTLILFKNQDDAMDFAKSVNGVIIKNVKYLAQIGFSSFCNSIVKRTECQVENCMYVHTWIPGELLYNKTQIKEMMIAGRVPFNFKCKTCDTVPPSLAKAIPMADRIGKFSPDVQSAIRSWALE